MEELRTTDILEREILDDARKKADRALKNAETEISSMEREWAAKLDAASAELEARFRKKLEDARRESESSLPLETKRKAIEYFDGILRDELERYMATFDLSRIEAIIRPFLERAKHLLSGKKLVVRCGGMKPAEAEAFVRSVCRDCSFVRTETSASIRGLVIELEDGTIRLTATLELVTRILLDEKREELYSSLFERKVSG